MSDQGESADIVGGLAVSEEAWKTYEEELAKPGRINTLACAFARRCLENYDREMRLRPPTTADDLRALLRFHDKWEAREALLLISPGDIDDKLRWEWARLELDGQSLEASRDQRLGEDLSTKSES